MSAVTDPAGLSSRFRLRFGASPRVFRAPGRVNIIGEHTDYNDGLVLPVSLDRTCWVAAAPRADRRLVVHSENVDETIDLAIGAEVRRTGTWRDYIAGVVEMLRRDGVPVVGANILLWSDIPVGAGLSSSAALEVGVATALLDMADTTRERTAVAQLCQRAENEIVGAACGIMDQYVACHGRAGTAVLLDCRLLEHRFLPLPSDVRLVVCNSMVRHSIADGEYRRRREECAAAVTALAARHPGIGSLRDVRASCLETAQHELPDVLFRRTRHVVTENVRVERAAEALERGLLEPLTRLMAESHGSLRDDYEVSCTELDVLVEIGAGMPGVIGARMTGGGFGGCTVNLVHERAVEEFVARVPPMYEARVGLLPELYVTASAEGASRIDA